MLSSNYFFLLCSLLLNYHQNLLVLLFFRGPAGPLPVFAHLIGLVVGGTPHGLQVPVDANPLCHLQLPAGKSDESSPKSPFFWFVINSDAASGNISLFYFQLCTVNEKRAHSVS